MENATKALIMAAGVLVGMMIISLGVYLYFSLSDYVTITQESIENNALAKFNSQFTKYINYNGSAKLFDVTIQDIVTVANIAYENNRDYNLDATAKNNINTLYVNVNVEGVSSFYHNANGTAVTGVDLEQKIN